MANPGNRIPKIIHELEKERPSFDGNAIRAQEPQNICWIDIMGAGNTMRVSRRKTAIFIGKFHSAILKAKAYTNFQGECFPVIDGAYIIGESNIGLRRFVAAAFKYLALTFILEERHENRFLIRGCIAFGNVITGEDLMNCSDRFTSSKQYAKNILFGAPLALAYLGERNAPPFGVYIDESARQFCSSGEEPIPLTLWPWWEFNIKDEFIDKHSDTIEKLLAENLAAYLHWCSNNSYSIQYDKARLLEHADRASQYFDSWPQL